MAKFTGGKETQRNIKRLINAIDDGIFDGMENATEFAKNNIKIEYDGLPDGFKDRSGELRKSIDNGVFRKGKDIIGFLTAGNERIGSSGKPTGEYAIYLEFNQTRSKRNTAFIVPGAFKNVPEMIARIRAFISEAAIKTKLGL